MLNNKITQPQYIFTRARLQLKQHHQDIINNLFLPLCYCILLCLSAEWKIYHDKIFCDELQAFKILCWKVCGYTNYNLLWWESAMTTNWQQEKAVH